MKKKYTKPKIMLEAPVVINKDKINRIRENLMKLDPEKEIINSLSKLKIMNPFIKPKKKISSKTQTESDSNILIQNKTINLTEDLILLNTLQNEINYLKSSSIENFSKEIGKKTDTEIKKYFPEKINDYNLRLQVLINKIEQQYNTYLQKLNNLKEKNIDLKNQIIIMKKEEEKTKNSLYDTNLSIEKLNLKYKIFSDLFPYYNTLLNEFDYDEKDILTPKRIIKDIKLRKKQEKESQEEINSLINKINEKYSNKYKSALKNRQKIEELSTKLNILEQDNSNNIEELQNKIILLKDKLSSNQKIKNENIKLNNMLISIFNELYNKLNLEREIIKSDSQINLIQNDYTPRTFDMEEIIRYINLMIKNGNESLSDSLLRQLIAFSNMILRNVRNINQNYDPKYVILEIEKLIKKDENEENNLKNIIESLKEENEKDEKRIKELNHKIKNYENKYNILMKKFNELFNEKNNSKEELKKDDTNNIKQIYQRNKNINFEKQKNLIKLKKNNLKLNDDYFEQTNLKHFPIFRKEKNPLKTHKNLIKLDYIDSTKSLIEHCNRLFLYKSKTSNNNVIHTELTIQRLNKKLKKIKNIQNHKFKFDSLEIEVEKKINGSLNRIIKRFNENEKEKNNSIIIN